MIKYPIIATQSSKKKHAHVQNSTLQHNSTHRPGTCGFLDRSPQQCVERQRGRHRIWWLVLPAARKPKVNGFVTWWNDVKCSKVQTSRPIDSMYWYFYNILANMFLHHLPWQIDPVVDSSVPELSEAWHTHLAQHGYLQGELHDLIGHNRNDHKMYIKVANPRRLVDSTRRFRLFMITFCL